jgi:uncharacterized protein YjcR
MTAERRATRKHTAEALAKKLGCHPRTIRRYMAIPRNQWEETNSISREKPWEALGISRATWYRKGKPTELPVLSVEKN